LPPPRPIPEKHLHLLEEEHLRSLVGKRGCPAFAPGTVKADLVGSLVGHGVNYEDLSLEPLRQICADLRVPGYGSKTDIINRLWLKEHPELEHTDLVSVEHLELLTDEQLAHAVRKMKKIDKPAEGTSRSGLIAMYVRQRVVYEDLPLQQVKEIAAKLEISGYGSKMDIAARIVAKQPRVAEAAEEDISANNGVEPLDGANGDADPFDGGVADNGQNDGGPVDPKPVNKGKEKAKDEAAREPDQGNQLEEEDPDEGGHMILPGPNDVDRIPVRAHELANKFGILIGDLAGLQLQEPGDVALIFQDRPPAHNAATCTACSTYSPTKIHPCEADPRCIRMFKTNNCVHTHYSRNLPQDVRESKRWHVAKYEGCPCYGERDPRE